MIKCFSTGKKEQEKYDNKERVIGTWFGKPLYRKTLTITSTEYENLVASGSKKIYPSNINIETIIRADLIVSYTNLDGTGFNTKAYGMHSIGTGAAYEVGVNAYNDGDLQIFVGANIVSYLINDTFYITLEYTKATD